MFYKALGFVVWKGAKLYLRRKLPSHPAMAAGVLGLALAGAAAAGAKNED